jgi:hypothetical protein
MSPTLDAGAKADVTRKAAAAWVKKQSDSQPAMRDAYNAQADAAVSAALFGAAIPRGLSGATDALIHITTEVAAASRVRPSILEQAAADTAKRQAAAAAEEARIRAENDPASAPPSAPGETDLMLAKLRAGLYDHA